MKRKYEDFSTAPGMSTWVDASPEYKRQYIERQKSKEIKKELLTLVKLPKEETTLIEPIETPIEPSGSQSIELITTIEKNSSGVVTAAYYGEEVLKKKKVKRRYPLIEITPNTAASNFIDDKFFDSIKYEITDKPLGKILLISDVRGWAWWNKSNYIKRYLSDEFHFDIINALEVRNNAIDCNKYDLYVTYGYSYITMVRRADISKRVTGITAHRPTEVISPMMNKARYLHANSMLLYNELLQMAKPSQKCYYVPNGVDEVLFHEVTPIKADGELVAGHVGKKCDVKGQDEFILPAIEKAGVQSIYNMNDYRDRKPYTEMWKMYQNMDVFIVASVEDGTPNGALEAAACGRPIISNRIGNMPEFIVDGENGFLVERNVDAYVEKLEYFKNNRAELIRMGKNARKTVEMSWTWKQQAENWRAMFTDILVK